MAKKLIALLLAVLMATALLAGCGEQKQKPSEGVIVIDYPTFQCGVNAGAAIAAKLVEEFNEQYKGKYQIKLEEVPGDANYVDKIKTQLGTGDLPPVIYGGGYNLLDLVLAKDLVVDLTPYIDADPEWKALYTEASLKTNSRNGKIYASSQQTSAIGYFYNKDLFKQAGIEAPAKTWDEFFAQCEKLKAAGITPLALDTADSAWVTQLWWGAMVATSGNEGLEFMQTWNPTNYNFPAMEEAVAKVQKMLQEYTTQDAIGGKYEHAANNFMSGQAAMIANSVSMINKFSDTTMAPEGFAEKVGVAVYPGNFVYDAPLQGYFATKQSDPKLQEAAVEMVKFFTSAHAQKLLLEIQGVVPASPTVDISDETKAKRPLLVDFLNQSSKATVRSDNMQATMFSNLLDVVSRELPRLYSGELDPKAFCQVMTAEAAKNN